MAGEFIVYGELAAAALGLAPFAWHRLSCRGWMKNELTIPDKDSKLPITVLLPVWNEGLIIEKKLADLAKQEIKSNLLLIDSASTDDTVSKARKWLKDFPDSFSSSEIIVMEKRLGKTTAVMQALDALKNFDGIIVMTDADAMIAPDSFNRIRRWFSNREIGVVGGTPQRIGDNSSELNHRNLYSTVRIAESHFDSTPFLEGSLIAWRSKLLDSSELYPTANADDAQIATAIRLSGFRSIQDSELYFYDQMPLTVKEQRRQKIRRGQGLIRLLSRKRKYWFSNTQGRFSKVLRMNAWMMLFSPLLVASALAFGLLRSILVGIDGNFHLAMTIAEIYCLASWLTCRMNIQIKGMQTAGSIFTGLENLLSGIILASTGTSLHMWDQHEEVREEMSRI